MDYSRIFSIILPPILFGLAFAIVVIAIISIFAAVIQYKSEKREKASYKQIAKQYDLVSLLESDSGWDDNPDSNLFDSLQKITSILNYLNQCEADTQKKKDIKRSLEVYYSPTIHKLTKMYRDAYQAQHKQHYLRYDLIQIMNKAKQCLSDIADALEKAQLLFSEKELYDVDTEAKVLQQKIQMDGLSNADFCQTDKPSE